MPTILTITIIHAVLFGLGGLVLGLMVFGVGFSESELIKIGYGWLFKLWQILNAPASYLTYYTDINVWLWIPTQIITSFVWANIYAFLWSLIRGHNKSSKPTPKSGAA